jgi:hypothetical protein
VVERDLIYADWGQVRSERRHRLLKLQSELAECSVAHMYDTNGMQRGPLRGWDGILKWKLIHAAAFNIALQVSERYRIAKSRDGPGASAQLLNWRSALVRLYAAEDAGWGAPEKRSRRKSENSIGRQLQSGKQPFYHGLLRRQDRTCPPRRCPRTTTLTLVRRL